MKSSKNNKLIKYMGIDDSPNLKFKEDLKGKIIKKLELSEKIRSVENSRSGFMAKFRTKRFKIGLSMYFMIGVVIFSFIFYESNSKIQYSFETVYSNNPQATLVPLMNTILQQNKILDGPDAAALSDMPLIEDKKKYRLAFTRINLSYGNGIDKCKNFHTFENQVTRIDNYELIDNEGHFHYKILSYKDGQLSNYTLSSNGSIYKFADSKGYTVLSKQNTEPPHTPIERFQRDLSGKFMQFENEKHMEMDFSYKFDCGDQEKEIINNVLVNVETGKIKLVEVYVDSVSEKNLIYSADINVEELDPEDTEFEGLFEYELDKEVREL